MIRFFSSFDCLLALSPAVALAFVSFYSVHLLNKVETFFFEIESENEKNCVCIGGREPKTNRKANWRRACVSFFLTINKSWIHPSQINFCRCGNERNSALQCSNLKICVNFDFGIERQKRPKLWYCTGIIYLFICVQFLFTFFRRNEAKSANSRDCFPLSVDLSLLSSLCP